jgi:putative photosynthetic complex assembly protein 2
MLAFLIPCAFALLVWWFTTGAILFLDGLPRATFRWSLTGASVVLLLSAGLLHSSAAGADPRDAYIAFSSAIGIWGWLEMTFLMGLITGTRRHACIERCSGWRHFFHATQAIIYNEIATALTVAGTYLATRNAVNRVAFWTLAVLWAMRVSAKLNLFLGVPNLGEQFLPEHLKYLKSFFRRRAINFLFPISVTLATLATAYAVQRLEHARNAFESTGLSLTIALLGLGLLEHWFLVLPLPSERLWNWAVPSQRNARLKGGRQTPSTMLASDSARSIHSPPHSVRSTSAS